MFASNATCVKYRGENLKKLPRPSSCGTHHLHDNGQRVYRHSFDWVLPYHVPGLAPVGDATGAYHIDLEGVEVYPQRYLRTFGFYCGHAAVVSSEGWYHVDAKGERSYLKTWDWCGNFQQDRCSVRNKHGEYYHIKPNGVVLKGGPHAYAGDFREGAAVVRGLDGLCRHVDLEGKLLNQQSFFDLDNFHKGFARACDHRGWFFINRDGEELLDSSRFAEIEPFYNGQALVRMHSGERAVLSEEGKIMAHPTQSMSERDAILQHLAVSAWGPLAVRLGIQLGIHGGHPQFEVDAASIEIVKDSWVELGLMDTTYQLTSLGTSLLPGSIWEKRFLYWTGPQLEPWLSTKTRLSTQGFVGRDFFSDISSNPHLLGLVHDVLDSYAQDDWTGIESILNLNKEATVVDVGGGRGALLQALGPTIRERILVDRPEVVSLLDIKGITPYPCDFFSNELPDGDVYILSRILHDWPDDVCKTLLSQIPKSSSLIVIDRVANPSENGLLSLNMLLVSGGKERDKGEWKHLVNSVGWRISDEKLWSNHSIFFLRGD